MVTMVITFSLDTKLGTDKPIKSYISAGFDRASI